MFQLADKRYEKIRLIFEEENHRYSDSLGQEYISVTTLLHQYKPKFDEAYWLKKKSKETGLSTSELKKQWDSIRNEACDRGNRKHGNLEDGIKASSQFKEAVRYMKRDDGTMVTVADIPFLTGRLKQFTLSDFSAVTRNKYPSINGVFEYYSRNGYQIYAEIGAFLLDPLISGTIDVLCVRDDGYVVGDWKTNRDGVQFDSGYYKKDKRQRPNQLTDEWIATDDKLLPPVHNLSDCNGSVYSLQLSFYSFMVERILGIPCKGIWLAHIDCDFVKNEYGMPKRFPDGTYRVKDDPKEKVSLYKINYLRHEVINVINDRLVMVNARRISDGTVGIFNV